MEATKALEEAKSGNIESFNELFLKIRGPLKSYLYRITANRPERLCDSLIMMRIMVRQRRTDDVIFDFIMP